MQRSRFEYFREATAGAGSGYRSGLAVPVAFMIAMLFLTTGAWASQCATRGAGRTFIQLWRADAQRTPAQWDQWFERLDSLGFTEIIVQWSSYGPVSFYADGGTDRETSLSLEALIQAARRHRKPMWLGLHYDPDFWSAVGRDSDGLTGYLGDRLEATTRCLPYLLRTVEKADPQGEVVTGWYISDEIDDQNWQEPARSKELVGYLAALRRALRKARKDWPVLISGFSNGKLPPAQWAAFWDALLQKTRIDGFLFQDGIGAGKLSFQELKSYLQSLSDTFARNDFTFGVIVELFVFEEQAGSPPELRAADFERVAGQLALARRFGAMPITVFSAPDYLVPADGEPGGRLYTEWRADTAACDPQQ